MDDQHVAAVDDPTAHASLEIILGPTSVKARGTVPVICIAGIFGAVATAWVGAYGSASDLIWFIGLAAGELALAGLVIFRLTRRPGRTRRASRLRP